MNERDIDNLVYYWQGRLGLSHWSLTVIHGEELQEFFKDAADHQHAACWTARDYNEAKIYFNPKDSGGWSMRDWNVNVVHELLHCVMRDTEYVIDGIDGMLRDDADRIVTRHFHHSMEGAIEHLARHIVQLAGGYERTSE